MIYSVCKCSTCLSVRYLRREKKVNDLERVCKPLLGSKAKPLPSKKSVKLKCQIRSEIGKKFAKKCLDASSRA